MKRLLTAALCATCLSGTTLPAQAHDWTRSAGEVPRIYCDRKIYGVNVIYTFSTDGAVPATLKYNCTGKYRYVLDCTMQEQISSSEYTLHGKPFDKVQVRYHTAEYECNSAYFALQVWAQKK